MFCPICWFRVPLVDSIYFVLPWFTPRLIVNAPAPVLADDIYKNLSKQECFSHNDILFTILCL